MKLIKKVTVVIMALCLALSTITMTYAAPETDEKQEVIYLDNGMYVVITLEQFAVTRSTNVGGRKTAKCYSGSDIVWTFTVEANFDVNYGVSATCNSVSHYHEIMDNDWKITSESSYKSGNSAKGEATGKTYFLGIPTNTATVNVTITCDNQGNLS
jgi:hypothetical protein